MNKLDVFRRNVFLIRNKNSITPSVCLKYILREKSTKDHQHNSSSSSDSSGSSSESDVESTNLKSKKETGTKNNLALTKLNNLLKQIIEEEVAKTDSKLDFAKPINRRVKKDVESESRKNETVEKQTIRALKNVAEELGGNVKQTESELILKLLSSKDSSLDPSAASLSDIVKGMKIDREPKTTETSRSEQVRSLLQQVRPKSIPEVHKQGARRPRKAHLQKQGIDNVAQRVDLFGSEPLGIFTKKDLKEGTENKTWQLLYDRDLRLAVTHPPANYFQQMILWTEQGKLWKFPIDNEQGLEEEKQVYFAKHVFLEEHLEPWCPQKGPIRHFMELVCVGLSKNPYLTAEAKKEHIDWYKNYFEDKKKLLQEVGALPASNKPTQSLE